MSPELVFETHLVLGYVAWLLCFGAYVWPWLKSIDRVEAQRAIATLHSFRFFGLVFILPGVVGPNLPPGFATVRRLRRLRNRLARDAGAAHGQDTAAVLAVRRRLQSRGSGRPPRRLLSRHPGSAFRRVAGELGAAYAIPILYVPLLMITHVVSLSLLARPQFHAAQILVGAGATSWRP